MIKSALRGKERDLKDVQMVMRLYQTKPSFYNLHSVYAVLELVNESDFQVSVKVHKLFVGRTPLNLTASYQSMPKGSIAWGVEEGRPIRFQFEIPYQEYMRLGIGTYSIDYTIRSVVGNVKRKGKLPVVTMN